MRDVPIVLRRLLFFTLTLEFRDEAKLGFVTATMITQVLKTANLAPASETATAFVFNSLQSVNFSKLPTMSRRYNFLEFWSAPIVFWFQYRQINAPFGAMASSNAPFSQVKHACFASSNAPFSQVKHAFFASNVVAETTC